MGRQAPALLELSSEGKTLIVTVVAGLVLGTVLAFVAVDGVPLTLILLQENGAVRAGAVWQLVTSIIVAPPNVLGFVDVAFNAIAIAWLDGFFTGVYNRRQYFAVFLITGVAGNLLSLANGPKEVSFGASGGLFGLLAGVISFDVVSNRSVNGALVVWFLAVFAVSSFSLPSVDWLAHLGGALVGFGLGGLIGVRRRDDPI